MFIRQLLVVAAVNMSYVALANSPNVIIKTSENANCDNYNCTVAAAKITGQNEVTYTLSPEVVQAFEKAEKLTAQVVSGEIKELSRPNQAIVSSYAALKATSAEILNNVLVQFCPMEVRAPIALYNSYNLLFKSANDITIFNSLQQSVLALFSTQVGKLETVGSCREFHEIAPAESGQATSGFETIIGIGYRFDTKGRVAEVRPSIYEALKSNFEVIEGRLQNPTDSGYPTPINQALMGIFINLSEKHFESTFKNIEVSKDVALQFDTNFNDITQSVNTGADSLTPAQQTVLGFLSTVLSVR